jgi:hypothetical protein
MAASIRNYQAGILAGVPRAARYLTFSMANPKRGRDALAAMAAATGGDEVVAGVSAKLADQLGAAIDGLRPFP